MQTRSIACFADGTGYALGSVEGRVAIQHIDDSKSNQNFSFKCHRKEIVKGKMSDVFAVNVLSFHPFGTFSTAGSDGVGRVALSIVVLS
jgi:mRNA export factor